MLKCLRFAVKGLYSQGVLNDVKSFGLNPKP